MSWHSDQDIREKITELSSITIKKLLLSNDVLIFISFQSVLVLIFLLYIFRDGFLPWK